MACCKQHIPHGEVICSLLSWPFSPSWAPNLWGRTNGPASRHLSPSNGAIRYGAEISPPNWNPDPETPQHKIFVDLCHWVWGGLLQSNSSQTRKRTRSRWETLLWWPHGDLDLALAVEAGGGAHGRIGLRGCRVSQFPLDSVIGKGDLR